MAAFEHGDDRLAHEAEELMRQRRFQDAAARYGDLLAKAPTDLWATLGRVSALECAGLLDEARTLLERLQQSHRRSASFQRFRHLFFVRREDFASASASQKAIRQGEVIDEGADDQLADLYFNQGRYHEAAGELARLLAAGLDDGDLKASVLARLGACQRQLGDAAPARENLLRALDLDAGNHWTLSELAEAERALGDADAARTRYREALEAAPDDHWTRGHLAQLEHEEGNTSEAIRLYEEVIERDPKAAWARVELGQVLTEGDPVRSRDLCRTALDLDPRNPWAHAQLGALARRRGEWADAREHYQRAHQGAPSAVWVLHELADCNRHLGRMEEAYAHLDRAREEEPYNAVSYGYQADFLRHEGRTAEALGYLAKAIEFDPAYAWAWRERAELLAQGGKHAEAEEAWRKACDLEPDVAINDGLRAFILRSQDRREAALPWLERAVERQPGYLWAWRERIEHHLAADRALEAEAVARAGLEALPEAAPVWGMLAEALRRQGIKDPAKRAQADAAVRKALELDPGMPQVWAIQAELAVERGDLALAETAARKAVELAAKHGAGPEYTALLAQVLTACDRAGDAEELLTGLLARQPALQPAWELAAVLAERRGDLARAKDVCDRALAGPLPGDARLRVRRARLGVQAGEDPARIAAELDPLFASDHAVVPWREVAQLHAQAGRPVEARRAAYLALEQAGDDAARRRARVQLAELELSLGNPTGAGTALDAVLRAEPDHLQARILGAALADHQGDLHGAIGHLQHLDTRVRQLLASSDPKGASHPEPPAGLLRQLAALYERSGDLGLAEKVWSRLIAHHPRDGEVIAEHAAFIARRTGARDAAPAVAAAEALVASGGEAHQRLLRELALAEAKAGRADTAVDVLVARDALLDHEGRLLLARLAVAAGQTETAKRHLEALIPQLSGERADAAELLLARARLGLGDPDAAARGADALWQRSGRRHEEAATVLAECHACRGRFAEALAVLEDPALPVDWTLERALLGAVVAMEERGEAWCLAVLGRHGAPTAQMHGLPLVRVLAAAWPGAWTSPLADRPVLDGDLASVPPFPRLGLRLAGALVAAGRADLAATHLIAVLAFHRRHSLATTSPLDRRLRRAAVDALVRAGRRWQAARLAVTGFNLRGLLRCLLP